MKFEPKSLLALYASANDYKLHNKGTRGDWLWFSCMDLICKKYEYIVYYVCGEHTVVTPNVHNNYKHARSSYSDSIFMGNLNSAVGITCSL